MAIRLADASASVCLLFAIRRGASALTLICSPQGLVEHSPFSWESAEQHRSVMILAYSTDAGSSTFSQDFADAASCSLYT